MPRDRVQTSNRDQDKEPQKRCIKNSGKRSIKRTIQSLHNNNCSRDTKPLCGPVYDGLHKDKHMRRATSIYGLHFSVREWSLGVVSL